MNRKAIVLVLIVGLGIALVAAFRTTNRADAAAGNCYADSSGPAEPTICS